MQDKLEFKYNDGGRSKYFTATNVGDCVTRAFAIVTGRDYKEIYDIVKNIAKRSPRNGVYKDITKKVAKILGGRWVPTMKVGQGCKVHLCQGEIPNGKIVCSVSKHLTAVIDGVINDTYDPSRNGSRCVYGYWTFN